MASAQRAHNLQAVRPDDPANASHWCRLWSVTRGQLQIAVSRVGPLPENVLAEIIGTPRPAISRQDERSRLIRYPADATVPAATSRQRLRTE